MPLLACAMIVGCWLQLRQPALWMASAYAGVGPGAGAALLALAWARVQLPAGSPRLRATRALLAAVAVAQLAFGMTGWRAVARMHDRLSPALWDARLQVRGIVRGLPSASSSAQRFEFAPLPGQGLPSRLLVSWRAPVAASRPRLRAGQAWSLPLRLRPARGLANPGTADAELRWLGQGIGGMASVVRGRAAPSPLRLRAQDRAGPWQRVQALRESLRARLLAALPDHARAGTLAALALGDQAAIGAREWQVYRATGVAHLMAISGLHVTMLAWLGGALVGTLWRRLYWRGVALPLHLAAPWPVGAARLLAALVYAAAAGLGVPAQRALLMLGVALSLRLCARRVAWPQVLASALCAVLLWDPWAIAQPGFWLSFGAVGALLLCEPSLASRQDAVPTRSLWSRAWIRLRAAARAQWAVSVALAPLTLTFFQQVSLVAPLANALAIPGVTLGVLPLSIAGFALPPPLDALAWRAAADLQDLVLRLLRPLEAWPFAQWQAAAPSLPELGLAAVALFALVLPWPWRLRLPGLALLGLLLAQPSARPPAGHLEAWIADVGQGGAIVLRTHRHTLVFDAGPPLGPGQDAGGRVLLPLLRQLGERRLDLVVLSHADLDHIGGAASLARAYPGTPAQGSVQSSRLRALGFASASRCLAGQHWEWDGVRFEWLHPAPGSPLREGNAGSCVLHVGSAQGSVLLTGDLERAQEAVVLRDGELRRRLRSDLLVAGHHGSRGSSSGDFLDAVAPKAVAVQCGLLNRYGHPHPALLQRLRERRLRAARTDLSGALFWSDREPARLRGWRRVRGGYWEDPS